MKRKDSQRKKGIERLRRRNVNRDLSRDDEGVAEVVGNILTLVITVVIFTSVFAAVTQLEGPDEQPHLEFEVEYEHTLEMDYINITHIGGKSLDLHDHTFIVVVDDEDGSDSISFSIDDDGVTTTGDGSRLHIGEEVRIEIEEGELDIGPDSRMELMVRQESNVRIIYQTVLLEEGRELLDIRNARIDYKFIWRNHAEPGEEITIRADVVAPIFLRRDEFDPSELDVTASAIEQGVLYDDDEDEGVEEVELEHYHNGEFRSVNVSVDDDADYASHSIKITAEYEDLEATPEYISLHVGKPAARRYRADLLIGDIEYRPGSPTHNERFTVEIEVFNRGAVNYTADWNLTDNGDLKYEDTTKFLAGPDPTVVVAEYDIMGVDLHKIEVIVDTTLVDEDGNEREDVEPDNNYESFDVYVDPNVLIVRDDTASESDELGLMENSLTDLNFDHTTYTVEPGGTYPDREFLSEYSLCIWLTGDLLEEDDDELEPLPPTQQDLLIEYIEENEGKLWLMGSNLEEVDFQSDFIDLLGISTPMGSGNEILLDGDLSNPEADEEGTYGDFTYPVYPGSKALELDLETDVEQKNTLEHDGEEVVGVGYERNQGERTALNSFLFDSVSDPASRSNMAQEVIKWLSDITERSGTDVSVSSQSIEPTAPMFMDNVTISATLRNNGPEDLNVTVRAVRNRGEEVLEPVMDEPWLHVPRGGGTAEIEFRWLADELGIHEFHVVADYYDEIDEVTLENNDITYKDLDITEDEVEVNVQYSTLVVDADVAEYENYENVTEHVTDSLDRLGQVRGETYDYYMVEGPDEHGPSVDKMLRYNAIFWITGERGDAAGQNIVLTEEDADRLLDYFGVENHGNVMFIGENILDYLHSNIEGTMDEIDPADARALVRYMGVDPYSDIDGNDLSPTHLIGEEDSTFGRNLRYQLEDTQDIDKFSQPSMYGEVLFTDGKDNIASVYDDGAMRNVYMGVNPHNFRGPLLTGEDFENWPGGEVDVSHENVRDEFIYNSLWYFGMRDERTDLRVTDYDIELSTDHPETGRSYEVTVEIENVGYKGASTMVRVKEGEDHVGTRTVFVESSRRESVDGSSYFEVEPGRVTAEFTWDPIFAGERPLRIKVDPLRLVDEIEPYGEEGTEEKIMEFNNQAVVTHPVYYFYDDMESGDHKWEHDSTLMNIDGVSPLDFIGRRDVDTHVEGDWDQEMTDGVIKQDEHSRTPPYSYFIEEDGDVEANALVSMVIDNSFSMGDRMYQGETWLWHAKEAAKFLVEDLSDESMVGLWNYQGTNPNQITEPLRLENHRDDIIDYIDGIESNPQAPVWDSVGGAYTDVNDLRDQHPELFPAVVTLTDGADKHAADNAANPDDFEQGSEDWAPWHKMENEDGTPIVDYDDSHMGKYRFDYREDPDPYEPGEWEAVPPHHAHDPGTRRGLLNSSFPIFTIGMGLEHNPDVDEDPEDPDWNPASDFASAGDDNYLIEADPNDERTWEAGTMEYNLWRIADTSDALYFYAPDPGDLEDIFDEIADLITDPGELRSVEAPQPLSEGSDESITQETFSDYEARAVTPGIDLTDATSAELTFWHRYNLLEGVNGAFLQIGFQDDDGVYNWHYVEPTEGSYNGNIFLQDEMPQDDYDNEIMWVWNRKSAQGRLDWEYSSLDLRRKVDNIMEEEAHNIPESALEDVRVGFYYTHYGFPPERGGWWLDDVTVTASSEWNRDGPSYWNLTSASQLDEMGISINEDNEDYHDHTRGDEDGHYWIFTTEQGGQDRLPQGIDSSLYTRPIYLDTADEPILTSHMKFNIDESAGMPPDGFRVEVSEDDGRTWDPLTYGVRTGWGASGDTEHGEYSGESEEDGYGWVNSDSLVRLESDLSGWRGERIILRFRVFTNTTETYSDTNVPRAIFLDDVWVTEADMAIGQEPHSLSFDGVNDHVNVGDSQNLQITGSKTVSMWLRPDSVDGTRRNPWYKSYGGEGAITEETEGGNWLSYYYGTAGGDSNPYQGFGTNRQIDDIDTGKWYHVTLVRDLDNMQLQWWINGGLDRSTGADYDEASPSDNEMLIGDGYTNSYLGNIDDVRIYDRALSQSEIGSLYGGQPLEDGLVGYWPMNEGSGDLAYDYSGNRNHGHIHGATWSTDSPFAYLPTGESHKMTSVRDITEDFDTYTADEVLKSEDPTGPRNDLHRDIGISRVAPKCSVDKR